jgi:hypothetical protein
MEAKFDVDENVQMEIKVPGKDDLILVKSNVTNSLIAFIKNFLNNYCCF